MGDRRPVRRPTAPVSSELVTDKRLRPFNAMTASAQILDNMQTRSLVIQSTDWQSEAWNFYRSLGEFRFAIRDWFAAGMSRIRLIAAIVRPGEDPTPVLDGPVADLVANLAGGIGGQSEMMTRLSVHLSVPGDSYFVIEQDPISREMSYHICTADEIRIKSRGMFNRITGVHRNVYEMMIDQNEWRELLPESMVIRIWRPDDQYAWKSSSACEAALPIMREVDYYNRYIVSVLLSRLALNGVLLVPSEVTFPQKDAYKDAADPFMAELIDIASKSIQNPGSAAAALPIPIRVPSQYIESFRHLTFDTIMHEDVLENRMQALKRLATALTLPAEVLTGMGDVNHWGQWQLEESAIKLYFSPTAEIICNGLTTGWMHPILLAAGKPIDAPDGGKYVVWYDPSNLAQTPDRTGTAIQMYDRGEIDGSALRREVGFEEADKPTIDELKNMVLQRVALSAGGDAMDALAKLTGDESLVPDESAEDSPESDSNVPGSPDAGIEPTSPDSRRSTPRGTPAGVGPNIEKRPPSTRPASIDVIGV